MYGLEYEKIAIDSTTYKNASYDYMEKTIKNFSHMKGWGVLYDDKTIIGALGEGSSVSLEPGCQFELSLEAKENIADIEKSAKEIFSLTQRIAKFYNVEFLNCGITPYSTYENINIVKKQRYEIMAEYLPKRAKLAPVMMRETAGVQLNVDYKSEDDAIEKIKLLSFISPFLTGFYANSPIRNNNLSGFKSFRAFAWKYTGKDRCGLFYKNLLDKKNATFDDYINAILDVPMLFIEIVQPARGSRRPGDQGLLLDSFLAGDIGFIQIKSSQPFPVTIYHGGDRMVRVHAPRISRHLGESGHPVRAHLLRHQQERVDDVVLPVRVYQDSQRVRGTISIPDPVVGIERPPAILMYLPIKRAIIATILTQADRALITTIQRGIKYRLLILRTSLHLDFAQRLVPGATSHFRGHIHVVSGDLPLQVLLSLLSADKGDTVTDP